MEFKLLNLNVWLGGILKQEILDFISKEKPDILNLQEIRESKNPNGEYQLKKQIIKTFGYKYSYFSPAFFDEMENCNSGNLIISKFPIVKKETYFLFGKYSKYSHGQNSKYFPVIPRNLQYAQIKIGNTTINDYNLHGIWAHKDGSDNPNRLRMSNIIVKQIKDKANVILTGDFNSQENTKTITNIEKYLINIFKNERKSSFNMKKKSDPGYSTAVVDFIFASNNLRILDKSMPQADISDHLPLVAKFAL